MRAFNRILKRQRGSQLLPLVAKIRSLFANGEQGAWYDPSDLTTLFQDAAGTTPVTAVEQPVGLMLDKSKGLVLGPELVVNGDFSQGATGWTLAASATVSSGAVSVLSVTTENIVTATAANLTQTKWFAVSFTCTVTSGAFSVFVSQVAVANKFGSNITTGGTKTGYVFCGLPGAGSNTIIFRSEGGFVGTIDNISVRALPGNHAFQTTSASRPVLSARINLLVNTEILSTQTRTVRAVEHVLSFFGTGTVTLSGVSTAGPLVGTGVGNRVYLSFVPTAGNLILTVSGSVTKAQLEEINESL